MKLKNIILLLILNFGATLYSQENTTQFLNQYKKWSVFWQYTLNKAGTVKKQDNSVQFSVPLYVNKRFGILYNVYKTNQLNFKAGVLYEIKSNVTNIIFTKEQTGWYKDFEYPIILYDNETKMWSIPLIVEYIKPLSKNIKWVIGTNITISYYTSFFGNVEVPFEYDSTKSILITYNNLSKNPIHTSGEISAGFYFLLKPLLLQTELRYSKSFSTLKSGSYLTKNFINSANNTTGTYKQSGDYFAFSLTVTFRKKKKIKK